jgi:uncharacterized membrane protein HdeD (DUF308 family)
MLTKLGIFFIAIGIVKLAVALVMKAKEDKEKK